LKDKHDFIDENCGKYSVSLLCRTLNVSKSNYYAAKIRPEGKREKSNQKLLAAILETHKKYPAMGLDSLYHYLKPKYGAGRARVHRLMKKFDIHSCRFKSFIRTTNSNHSMPISPNILSGNFKVDSPNKVWVGDITYIPTEEGWLYLAIVKDLCTKKIVGYSFSDSIDSDLVCDALNKAIFYQRPHRDLIFHSDRGSQYASNKFRYLLSQNHITQSMSRKGNPYDNAVAENFFSCLKCECLHLQSFHTRTQAKLACFRYIEGYYNSVRPHSGINWLSPIIFEHSFSFNF
jgi:transposase InsO family protein